MCKHGDTRLLKLRIPADLIHNGAPYIKEVSIDRCILSIIDGLNRAGIYTRGSCCGHGKKDGIISLEDGRNLIIQNKPAISMSGGNQ